MTDIYTKQFIAMRYWLLGRNYFLALNALEYAAKLHTGKRKDGKTQEYFHQLSIGRYVKSISTSLEYPEATLATVFLHDICEDYGIGFEEIESRFGVEVAQAVRLMTKKFRGYRKPDAEYYREIINNKIASVTKGADRIHNIQTMVGVFTYDKQKEYIQETEAYILPALKEARRYFPRQEPAYENIRHVLVSQIELLRAVHKAQESDAKA
jgi:(p)ppGpp synthase/HD superfamily hydrolase